MNFIINFITCFISHDKRQAIRYPTGIVLHPPI